MVRSAIWWLALVIFALVVGLIVRFITVSFYATENGHTINYAAGAQNILQLFSF